jgi:quinol monooxygenase YgiN
MPSVSITRLRVRKWRYLPSFVLWALRSARQARQAPGNLGVDLLRDRHNAFWTKTVWTDDAAMRAFMLSHPHKAAMPKLLDWCDEASLVRWTQDDASLPSWTDAHRWLEQNGRPSKVNHPSDAHRALKFPPPNGREPQRNAS